MKKNIVIDVECDPDFSEILMAELGDWGYDTFQETDNGFTTYQPESTFDVYVLEELADKYQDLTAMTWKVTEVEQQNWNQVWESNYEAINVDDKVLVRADFHPTNEQYPYEIVINPRMSFGTGHHETTYLVLSTQLEIDHQDKKVLDAGCGTAILAIMAGKLGAREVVAYDNDVWVIENAEENLVLNKQEAEVFCGVLDDLDLDTDFDIILANINKNVLIEEMGNFSKLLVKDGKLVLSGFYVDDLDDLIDVAEKNKFVYIDSKDKNNWCAATFRKAI